MLLLDKERIVVDNLGNRHGLGSPSSLPPSVGTVNGLTGEKGSPKLDCSEVLQSDENGPQKMVNSESDVVAI